MSEQEKKGLSEEALDNVSGGFKIHEYNKGGRKFDLTDAEVEYLKANGFEGRYGWNGEKHGFIKKKGGNDYRDLKEVLEAAGFRQDDLSSDR